MNRQIFVDEVAFTLKDVEQTHSIGSMYGTQLVGTCSSYDFTEIRDRKYLTVHGTGIKELDNCLVYVGSYSLIGLKTVECKLVCCDAIRRIF